MKKVTSIFVYALAASVLLLSTAATTPARSGGGGGGGNSAGASNARHGGNFRLTYDASPDAGASASCTGTYNLSTYVTTLTMDYKCSNLDLPDGTEIYANVLTTDYFSGLPWAPIYAGSTTVTRGKASFSNPNVWTTPVQGGLPVMRFVILTLADGTVLFVGHP